MSLVLPHGLRGKRVEDLTAEEMGWISLGEAVLRKMGLTLACQNCLRAGLREGAVLQGANGAGDAVLSVTCGCRRLQYRQKAD